MGYSPWGHKESDTTEWLILSHDKLSILKKHHFADKGLYSQKLWFFQQSCTDVKVEP